MSDRTGDDERGNDQRRRKPDGDFQKREARKQCEDEAERTRLVSTEAVIVSSA
ncbi:hypothetical protein [Bradyrhizobium iriomotense]|uniref:Transposase n=1 Tax=Bradyrhizobium iriomotense TaxID=441950 RepID=A0ABQ6B019_9BRAD|nr:hypothetical protein [Bradyrhizobium iriomotense]GLR87787.1 hypothetical protein GCM10007857_44990 [Bradyrhizobium iriomotense]